MHIKIPTLNKETIFDRGINVNTILSNMDIQVNNALPNLFFLRYFIIFESSFQFNKLYYNIKLMIKMFTISCSPKRTFVKEISCVVFFKRQFLLSFIADTYQWASNRSMAPRLDDNVFSVKIKT